ncbi:MAG TPA: hypothetical protein DCE41_03470 [Cytophagales bacterium]|nr:hypothetical protein [Cytophagales bacterium]HAA24001.1 hypothetical protein [Cytophagales bacterium]HAP63510.1 hypothetical protein [Cytophagales bacterium]
MKSILSLFVAAIFWGLNFHFIKFMFEESAYAEAGVWRYALATLTMVVMSVGAMRKWKISQVPWKGVLLVGAIGLLGFNLAVYVGMQYTSALNASLIMSLNPVTTILFSSLILKTEARWYHFLGAAISFVGVLLLISQGQLLSLQSLRFNKGDLLVFVGNLVFAFYHIGVKQFKKDTPNLQFTAYTNFVCMLGFMLIIPLTPAEIRLNHSAEYWTWALLLAVVGTAISFMLWNYGVTQIGADRAGIFMNVVPLATAISALFFGLEVQAYHLYSGLTIIMGIVLTQAASYWTHRKKRERR